MTRFRAGVALILLDACSDADYSEGALASKAAATRFAVAVDIDAEDGKVLSGSAEVVRRRFQWSPD
jgi:hypothetical protein